MRIRASGLLALTLALTGVLDFRSAFGAETEIASAPNTRGSNTTISTAGPINSSNLFFTPLGNGRSCASCHDQSAGWSVTPALLVARFAASNGLDPVFLPVDGATSPNAAVATTAERSMAYSMLLGKGLFRIGLPIPANAQFSLVGIDDPYGFASPAQLSLFRRPLPPVNENFLTAVMWDGRETAPGGPSGECIKGRGPEACFAPLTTSLANQANNAVLTHAQLPGGLTAAQALEILDLTTTLFAAQSIDAVAGNLAAQGGHGGPVALAAQGFYFGINDPFAGDYRTGRFNRNAMNLFAAWINKAPPPPPGTPPGKGPSAQARAQASIARGEVLFNTRPFMISGVAGFNDVLGRAKVEGTCTSCHSAPNVGAQSVPRYFNTGISSAALRTPDLPLYTLVDRATGVSLETSDPGLALQTGLWQDIGKMKVPGLRDLAARAPYFHNGSAPDIAHVIGFYDRRFQIGLTREEQADLAAFLGAL
jgi:cytochrome c peroxidase